MSWDCVLEIYWEEFPRSTQRGVKENQGKGRSWIVMLVSLLQEALELRQFCPTLNKEVRTLSTLSSSPPLLGTPLPPDLWKGASLWVRWQSSPPSLPSFRFDMDFIPCFSYSFGLGSLHGALPLGISKLNSDFSHQNESFLLSSFLSL